MWVLWILPIIRVVPIAAVAAVVASYSYSRALQMLDFFLDSYKTIRIWAEEKQKADW